MVQWIAAKKLLKGLGICAVLLLPAMACSTLVDEAAPTDTPLPAEVTAAPTGSGTIPTETVFPAELPPTETPAGQPTGEPSPTGITLDPTPTLALRATNTPATGDFPPLTFVWEISWELAENNPGIAIATITVTAAGGSGQYTYYQDEIMQDGPVFSYEWATCKPRPGSIRVASSDGQSVSENYFERSPCPATNTPGP